MRYPVGCNFVDFYCIALSLGSISLSKLKTKKTLAMNREDAKYAKGS
jgi:hypothetical protein